MKKFYLFIIQFVCMASIVSAHDFEFVYKSKTLFFNVLSSEEKTAVLTYEGDRFNSASYEGNIQVPEEVEYNGGIYTVTTIGNDAFVNCKKLLLLELPKSINRIGNSAFFGTVNLDRIILSSDIEYGDYTINNENPIFIRNQKTISNQSAPMSDEYKYEEVNNYRTLENNYDVTTAKKNGLWGLIDRMGKVVIPFEYEEICTGEKYSAEMFFAKKNGVWGIIDLNNDILLPFTKADKNKVRKSLKPAIKMHYKKKEGKEYKTQMERIHASRLQAYLVVNEQYFAELEMKEKKRPIPKKESDLWGFVEKDGGVEIIKPSYSDCIEYENYYFVQKNDLWGFVDKEVGKEVVPPVYNGYVKVNSRLFVLKDSLWGLIGDNPVKPILDCEYEIYTLKDNHDFYFIYNNDKYGLINKNGYFSLSCIYDKIIYADDVSSSLSNYFYLIKNDKWGWASAEKGELCECKYDVIGDFKNGVATVYKKGHEGEIDYLGKETKSIAGNAFNSAYNLNSDTHYQEKINGYFEVISLDEDNKEGYAALSYNNIGVVYETIFDDKEKALAYYNTSHLMGSGGGSENFQRLKKQLNSEKWQAAADALANAAAALSGNRQSTSDYNSNAGANYSKSTVKTSTDCSSYQERYNVIKSKKNNEEQSNARREGNAIGKNAVHNIKTSHGVSDVSGAASSGDYRVINSSKALIREYERQMNSIAQQAQQAGCSIVR